MSFCPLLRNTIITILMNRLLYLPLVALLASCAANTPSEKTLKEAFADNFLIGGAINTDVVNGNDPKGDSIVTRHFNTIVAENCMKSAEINPAEGVYNWDDADKFVKYGEDRGMFIVGHTLIWHSQLAPWFTRDSLGNNVTPEVLKERMRTHINTMMSRYKGRVQGWDVVNEAILDDGSYRQSPFYEILGEEFIPLAFQYAMEADPDAELYINDYSMASPGKRDRYVQLVNDLRSRGLRVDAIGMQGHMGMDYPDFTEFERSIIAFGTTGAKVMITEWDMSALPTVNTGANIADTAAYQAALNPYPDGLPEDVATEWNDRMGRMMDMFVKHSDIITRVNAWGTDDSSSWKNNWPVAGRVEYPLLFDRNYTPKPFLTPYL